MAGTPLYSYYGESAMRNARSSMSPNAGAPQAGGMPFLGHTRCMANEETCQGARAKGTDYCIGHLRQMTKEKSNEQTGD